METKQLGIGVMFLPKYVHIWKLTGVPGWMEPERETERLIMH